MIIINTCHIPKGEIHTVDGTESSDILEFTESKWTITAKGDIQYHLYASMAGQDLVVRGKVAVPIETECARCAATFQTLLQVADLCIMREKVSEQEVDLTDEIREELLLSVPMRFLCSEECQGICPDCHVNLNAEKCKCTKSKKKQKEELAVEEEESPWSVLDQLELPAEKKSKKSPKK